MATKIKTEHRQVKGRDYSPKWDGAAELSPEQYLRKWHEAMSWYRLETSNKELKSKVIDWMGRNDCSKDQISAFKKTKDSRCNGTMGAIAACLIKGMPVSHQGLNKGADVTIWLRNQIEDVIAQGVDDIDEDAVVKVEKVASPVITIQDRIREQAGTMSEEIDAAIDSWILDPEAFDPKAFKIPNLLRGKGAKAPQARYIKTFFQSGLDELLELASGNADDQLREAYSHNSRKNVKKLIEFYQSIMTACDQIAQEAKVLKKPRAKKIKPAEQIVSKLKFKVSEDKLGISSVPPATIIGAGAAVVYNTKTRKIGIYIAKTSAGLNVKGTSIIDFTEKSTMKTLRKPLEQIKEFKEQNTQRRVESWFNGIKTTAVMANGRMNEDIVILKAFK